MKIPELGFIIFLSIFFILIIYCEYKQWESFNEIDDDDKYWWSFGNED